MIRRIHSFQIFFEIDFKIENSLFRVKIFYFNCIFATNKKQTTHDAIQKQYTQKFVIFQSKKIKKMK